MTTTIINKNKKPNVPNSTDKGNVIRNVPHLRFPEFEGEWEKCKFKDVCSISTGNKNTQDKADDGIYPFYVRSQTVERINSWTFDGEAILTAGDGVGVGKVFHHSYGKIGVHQRVYILSDFKCDANYLFHFFSSKFYNRVKRMSAKNSVDSVRKEMITDMPLSLPCHKEQVKIGHMLSLLDERIATQNKIIEKMQTLIKGMEDNLLDNPLWQKTYLHSFMQFFSTNSLSWEQLSYEDGKIRNLHYGLIHSFQTSGINSASLPMVKYGAIPKQYTLCQVGDVAFADASEDTNEIGKSVEFVDTIDVDTICGLHTIHGRDVKDKTLVGFKGFAFNSRYFHNQIKRLAQGTKVFSITANNLSSCYVYLPDLETQKAIVNLLKTYEAKLLVSKRLLEHYEKQKQYLLRQMFI